MGIQTAVQGEATWFVNGHYNWWDDEQEPFKGQWELTESKLAPYMDQPLYIMGDFNNVAEVRGEGYDYMMSKGWNDLYTTAEQRMTVQPWSKPLPAGRITNAICVLIIFSRIVRYRRSLRR